MSTKTTQQLSALLTICVLVAAITAFLPKKTQVKENTSKLLSANIESIQISKGNFLAVSTKPVVVRTFIKYTSVSQIPKSQNVRQVTPYDYLSLLPLLITAATPLILGLVKAKSSDKVKK